MVEEVQDQSSNVSDTDIRAQEQRQAIVKFLVVLFIIFVIYYSSGISDGI